MKSLKPIKEKPLWPCIECCYRYQKADKPRGECNRCLESEDDEMIFPEFKKMGANNEKKMF